MPGRPLYAVSEVSDGKVFGFPPETVDTMFSSSSADHVLVEADGARRMLIKAPGDYEPVIPSTSTTVVVVVGAGALGRLIGAVAHRPERIETLTGLSSSDVLTPEGAAAILLHPDGGLKGIPGAARVVMVIANVTDTTEPAATALAELLAADKSVDRCLLIAGVD
jgi:probable selenium-dependent hydroxylase accessory protein YqeC